ncbi:GNAT family N-acetyltransferase [Niastella sp. OAS944]|uniref:GNAT family N-acetyltransferase n=1 Tax=Niastella sp. OAS944 TaxID=2664089 RepID=UPI0034902F94|nr:GNAT superfamily N-acetyltransferase [Chitinophagaceae bacterium OAS944]
MIENNCIIRQAIEADVPVLALLMTELGYPTTATEMQTRYEALQSQPDYITWVAVYNNQVVGMIGLLRNYYWEKNGIYIRVGALVVNKEYRKIGLGKALLQKSIDWAIELGAQQVLLNSGNREERRDAHAFYQYLGFEPKTTGFVKTINS